MSTVKPADQAVCPQCGHDTPQHEGLRRWCERCNWNVAAPDDIEAEAFLARTYRRLGERWGKQMLDALIAQPAADLRPRMTLARACAFAIAGGIHLLSAGIFMAGLVLALRGYPDILSLVGAAFCIGLAWLLLPGPVPVPKKAVALATFPALRMKVNEITDRLGGERIEHIVIDEGLNASYTVAGWRRQPVLEVGLPLWIALRPQERIALLAHEIAHGVNNDSMRSFVVGSALGALDEWIGLLRPQHDAMALSELVARRLTWLVSLPLVLLQGLLVHLLWQDKQRAEYFADYLAATIAGPSATIGMLHRTALHEHLDDVLMRHAYSSAQSGRYILDLFRNRVDNLPEREWERMRRASEAEGARLDDSHPPTAFRVAFIEAQKMAEPKLIASAATMAAIDAEFQGLEERLGRKLIARVASD